MFSDNFFKKVEKKTNVNKETILSLADKLQKGNMKDETTLKEVINDYLYYYNNRRIKLKLKGLTPAQHRYQTLQVA